MIQIPREAKHLGSSSKGLGRAFYSFFWKREPMALYYKRLERGQEKVLFYFLREVHGHWLLVTNEGHDEDQAPDSDRSIFMVGDSWMHGVEGLLDLAFRLPEREGIEVYGFRAKLRKALIKPDDAETMENEMP